MTDHGSREGSRVPLEKAVERLTGAPPLAIDARHFMTGGSGRVGTGRTGFQLEVPSQGYIAAPEVLIVYEIPPADRRRLVAFQRQLSPQGPLSFSADPDAWRNATDNGAPSTSSAATASPTWKQSRCTSRIRGRH
jgi:hypothetical protein